MTSFFQLNTLNREKMSFLEEKSLDFSLKCAPLGSKVAIKRMLIAPYCVGNYEHYSFNILFSTLHSYAKTWPKR